MSLIMTQSGGLVVRGTGRRKMQIYGCFDGVSRCGAALSQANKAFAATAVTIKCCSSIGPA